jgi:hypothetical protein
VGQNGTHQRQAVESVTRGDRWRRELWGSKIVATARLPASGVRMSVISGIHLSHN